MASPSRSLSTRFVLALGVLALGLSTVGSACSSSGADAKACKPGDMVFCRCADRSSGTKLCKADGNSYEPCQLGENLPCGESSGGSNGTVDPPYDSGPFPTEDSGKSDGASDGSTKSDGSVVIGPQCTALEVCCGQIKKAGSDPTVCEAAVVRADEAACTRAHDGYKTFGPCT
ncbi:MAG: hypothetical protein HOO96_27200 [Polyangiaceae bacterium]|nr:hypothetical protein [Polyangiaceae bacterium]